MIEDSPQKQHFVKDIIDFAHDNDILALAEGVETEDELMTVIMLGADLIQGYFTAKPEKEMLQSVGRRCDPYVCGDQVSGDQHLKKFSKPEIVC